MKDRLFSIEAVHAEYRPYWASNSKVTLQQTNFSKSSDVQIKKDEKSKSFILSQHAPSNAAQVAFYKPSLNPTL